MCVCVRVHACLRVDHYVCVCASHLHALSSLCTGYRRKHFTMTDERMGDGWPGQFLQQAVLYDNAELLQCLLEGEELANINATDACGRTAVYTAVSNNSLQCLRLLLEYGGIKLI